MVDSPAFSAGALASRFCVQSFNRNVGLRQRRTDDGSFDRRAFVGAAVAAPAMAALPISLQFAGAQDAIVATMVTDTAGLGDQNFNDLANAGGAQAATDFGIEWKVIESVDIPSYVPNLTAAAERASSSLRLASC